MEIEKLQFQVEAGTVRVRLDDYLFARMHTLSRMYLRELVKTGRVVVNGDATNVGRRVSTNDFIEIEADMTRGTAMRPEDLPLDILFEDNDILVVNKPAGMLVHPTHRDRNGTLLNALTYHLNRDHFLGRLQAVGGLIRPGLVHRLDRETSGLMVIAVTAEAHRKLAADLMRKRVEKRYTALVEGVITEPDGTIDLPVGRYAERKAWDVHVDGKHAVSRFRVLESKEDRTLVELEPVTGRTNQLRIHCAAIGHPIFGDTARGGRPYERLCLNASKLSFTHPMTRETLAFEQDCQF